MQATELRCDHRKHAEISPDGMLEVRCRKPACGYEPGVVVIHRFDLLSGELVSTRKFREPPVSPKRRVEE